MFASRLEQSVVLRVLVVALSVLALSMFVIDPDIAGAINPRVVPTCFHNQLDVAVSWDEPPAAGSNGIPFIIANVSKSSCSIQGFPKLDIAPDSYKHKTVKVFDGGGGLFARERPHRVIIKPGEDASFGLGFGDGSNQQDPIGPACTTQDVEISLPVRVNQIAQNYETPLIFNFCDTDFEVEVTPFEPGPLPKPV